MLTLTAAYLRGDSKPHTFSSKSVTPPADASCDKVSGFSSEINLIVNCPPPAGVSESLWPNAILYQELENFTAEGNPLGPSLAALYSLDVLARIIGKLSLLKTRPDPAGSFEALSRLASFVHYFSQVA